MKLIRKQVVAGEETAFTFDRHGYSFLIKNFTAGSIFVSDTHGTTETARIESKHGQEFSVNEFKNESIDTVYITAEIDGEVEVQCTAYL